MTPRLWQRSEKELKSLLMKGKEESEKVGLKWNIQKTKIMAAAATAAKSLQSCPTLCDPMNCSTPGLPVHHQLLEFTQTHVHSRWCHPAISSSVIPFSFCLQSFPASRSFQTSQFFTSGGENIGISALTSVLPMNIHDLFPLGWTGWISLQSKGLSRVFSNTTVQNHQFFSTQLLYIPILTSTHDNWKNHSFD